MSGFATRLSPERGSQIDGRGAMSAHPAASDSPAFFSGILPGDYAAIASAAHLRVFSRGEILHLKGDSVQQVLLLTSGLAKISQIGATGNEVILRLGVPGDVLGASGLLSGGLHYTTAQAFRICRVLSWDSRLFKGLAERFPVLHQNLARILGAELTEMEERFSEVATEKVPSRVARQLMRLRGKIGLQVDGDVQVCLSREELAQMTGTTLFTVSRLLSAWEARGIVRPSREAVTICDAGSLRSLAEE
jgi:CRP/FNR family transcriptional regulator, nitrogen oxide reductase regulator